MLDSHFLRLEGSQCPKRKSLVEQGLRVDQSELGSGGQGDRGSRGVLVGDGLEGEVEAAGAGVCVRESFRNIVEELRKRGVLVAKDGDFPARVKNGVGVGGVG